MPLNQTCFCYSVLAYWTHTKQWKYLQEQKLTAVSTAVPLHLPNRTIWRWTLLGHDTWKQSENTAALQSLRESSPSRLPRRKEMNWQLPLQASLQILMEARKQRHCKGGKTARTPACTNFPGRAPQKSVNRSTVTAQFLFRLLQSHKGQLITLPRHRETQHGPVPSGDHRYLEAWISVLAAAWVVVVVAQTQEEETAAARQEDPESPLLTGTRTGPHDTAS